MGDRRYIELYALGLALDDPARLFAALDRAGAGSSDFVLPDIGVAVDEARSIFNEMADVDVAMLGRRLLARGAPLRDLDVLQDAFDAVPYDKTTPDEEIASLAGLIKSRVKADGRKSSIG